MRTLTGQGLTCNTSEPAKYPFGRIKDDSAPGVHDGTPLTELAPLSDLYQGVMEQFRLAGVTPDEAVEQVNASQIVEAFGWFAPVAVIRVGATIGNLTPRVLGGKYQPGYSATFAYQQASSHNGALFKLAILKGGSASATEKYCVQVTNARGDDAVMGTTDTAGIAVSANHDVQDAAFYFTNNTDYNISAACGNASDADEDNLKLTPMIITVHRVA